MIVLTKKFLDTSNLDLIKEENDVGRNRLAPICANICCKIISNPSNDILIF